MKTNAQEMYAKAKAVHEEIYRTTLELSENVEKEKMGELVDLAYACRETINYLQDAMKALKALKGRVEKYTCLRYMQEVTLDGEEFRIHTPHCSAGAEIKQYPKYPSKRRYDEEGYDKLMRFFGVKDEFIEWEVLRPNWDGLAEWTTNQAKNGLPVPFNPHDVMTNFSLSLRKKKSVDTEVE